MFILVPVLFYISLGYILFSIPEWQHIVFKVAFAVSLFSGVTYGIDERLFGFTSIFGLILCAVGIFIPENFNVDTSIYIDLALYMGLIYLMPIFFYTIYYYITNMIYIEETIDEAKDIIDDHEKLKDKNDILKRKNKELHDKNEQLTKENQELSSKYVEILNNQQDIEDKKLINSKEIEELNRELNGYKAKVNELSRLESIEKDLIEKELEIEEYQRNIELQIKSLSNDNISNQKEVLRLKSNLKKSKGELSDLKNTIKLNHDQIIFMGNEINEEKQKREEAEKKLKETLKEKNVYQEKLEKLMLEIKNMENDMNKNKDMQRIGEFIKIWAKIEKLLGKPNDVNDTYEAIKYYYENGMIDRDLRSKLQELRKKRNGTAHDGKSVSIKDLEDVKSCYEDLVLAKSISH